MTEVEATSRALVDGTRVLYRMLSMPRVRAVGPVVLIRWTHTQGSKIVRPDRYRQSGTDNADANVDDRKWRGLDNTDRLTLVELNRAYYLRQRPEEWAIAINTDDKGGCRLNEAAIRDEVALVHGALEKLCKLGLATRRGRKYQAVVTSDGFDVGLVVAVGGPNVAGLEVGEYVLFDSGTAISIGWPATEEEIAEGLDGQQAGWAGHKLACRLDDPIEKAPDDLPGSEDCRNFYHFIPADRVAVSLGFAKPQPGEIA